MRFYGVIGVYPGVEVGLQLHYRSVYLISEYDSTELVLYRSVESFTDAVCQWTLCLDLEVVDVLNGHI